MIQYVYHIDKVSIQLIRCRSLVREHNLQTLARTQYSNPCQNTTMFKSFLEHNYKTLARTLNMFKSFLEHNYVQTLTRKQLYSNPCQNTMFKPLPEHNSIGTFALIQQVLPEHNDWNPCQNTTVFNTCHNSIFVQCSKTCQNM